MTNSEFLSLVMKARDTSRSFDNFFDKIKDIEQFISIVDAVDKITQKWGVAIGLTGKKEETKVSGLSSKEEKWKSYFEDHTFSCVEEQRNLADAFSIVEGIDLNRFLKIIKPSRAKFPKFLSIVPLTNNNGHSYMIGAPILSLGNGTTFYSANGASGNQMDTTLRSYRLSSREETEMIVSSLMYRISSCAELLLYGLIIDSEGS